MFNFHNKIVVVTGGSKGIGAAIVEQFLNSGAVVIIADVDPEGEASVKRWHEAGKEAAFVHCNVADKEDVTNVSAFVKRNYGRIDVLVNNAGIFPRSEILEMEEAFWDQVMNVNLKGTFFMCQSVIPIMQQAGGGCIVNIGSLHHTRGQANTLAYAISKSGIVTLTNNLANTFSKDRIRVNGVHPGWVMSEGEAKRIDESGEKEKIEQSIRKIPFGRMQTGDDIAQAVLFLASDLAEQITGQFITVDGGMSVGRH